MAHLYVYYGETSQSSGLTAPSPLFVKAKYLATLGVALVATGILWLTSRKQSPVELETQSAALSVNAVIPPVNAPVTVLPTSVAPVEGTPKVGSSYVLYVRNTATGKDTKLVFTTEAAMNKQISVYQAANAAGANATGAVPWWFSQPPPPWWWQ